jgi:hypothetical protein
MRRLLSRLPRYTSTCRVDIAVIQASWITAIIADRLAGDAAEISKGADMRRDPIRACAFLQLTRRRVLVPRTG